MTPNEMLSMIAQLRRERDELAALLAAEKATRNSIIEKGVKTERERDEAREKYDILAVENMLEVNKLCKERDEALMDRANGDMATMTINHYERLIKERDEARADAAKVADILSGLELRSTEELARLEQERNEALAQIKELMYIGERAIALAEIDFENDKFGVVSELRDDLAKIKKSNDHF